MTEPDQPSLFGPKTPDEWLDEIGLPVKPDPGLSPHNPAVWTPGAGRPDPKYGARYRRRKRKGGSKPHG